MMILQLFSRSKWSILYIYISLITVGNKQNIMTNKVYCPPVHPKMSRSIYPLFNLLQHCFGVCSIFRHAQITEIAIFFCLNQLISPFFLMLSWYYFNFKMKNNEKHQSIDLICSFIFKKVRSGLLPNSSTQTIPQKILKFHPFWTPQRHTSNVVVVSPGRPEATSGRASASSSRSPSTASEALAVLETMRMWSFFLAGYPLVICYIAIEHDHL